MRITVRDNVKYYLVGEGSKSGLAVIDDSCDHALAEACLNHVSHKRKEMSKEDAVKLIKAGVALLFTPAAFDLVIAES